MAAYCAYDTETDCAEGVRMDWGGMRCRVVLKALLRCLHTRSRRRRARQTSRLWGVFRGLCCAQCGTAAQLAHRSVHFRPSFSFSTKGPSRLLVLSRVSCLKAASTYCPNLGWDPLLRRLSLSLSLSIALHPREVHHPQGIYSRVAVLALPAPGSSHVIRNWTRTDRLLVQCIQFCLWSPLICMVIQKRTSIMRTL